MVALTLPTVKQATDNFLTQTFTHQPEALTELYFADVRQIPVTFVLGQPLSISFRIHNLENHDVLYRYRIYVGDLIPSGTPVHELIVMNGVSTTTTTSLATQDFDQRAKITVELIDQHQTIHFWVEQQL